MTQDKNLIIRLHRSHSGNTHNNTTKSKLVDDAAETSSMSSQSPLVNSITTHNVSSATATASAAANSTLTNPFRGLHERITRSYRLDPLMTGSTGNDILLARQERRSTAFSFLKFQTS